MSDLTRLHWTHPNIGEIDEIVCPAHGAEVCVALTVLGIGSIGSDGSVRIDGVEDNRTPTGRHAHGATRVDGVSKLDIDAASEEQK